jgi:hypothetical protein
MKSNTLIFICLFLIFPIFSVAEEICPGSDKLPAASGAEELKMYEKDFNFVRAMESVSWLEKDLIQIIKKHEHKSYSVLDYEGFYIGYTNHLTFVKGTLLKQEALITKNKLEFEKLKLKHGINTKEDVSKAEKAYFAAKKKFCDFLKEAEYVD